MSRILKWPLDVTDRQTVPMPHGSRLLTAQLQRHVPMLWVLTSNTGPMVDRVIAIYGTGNPMPDQPGEYIATFQQDAFVWHVFDLGEQVKP